MDQTVVHTLEAARDTFKFLKDAAEISYDNSESFIDAVMAISAERIQKIENTLEGSQIDDNRRQ